MKHYEAEGFKVGDFVKVVNYGSIGWVNMGGGVYVAKDFSPERIGIVDFISEIIEKQGVMRFSLSKSAWYYSDQLEKVEQTLH